MNIPKLTMNQQLIYDALLPGTFLDPSHVADRAGITTSYPRETAAKYCIQLVKLGLAVKGGSPKFPSWKKVIPPSDDELDELIQRAIDKAALDGEGEVRSANLRRHLTEHRLKIVKEAR